jgi:hypothetical protein
MSISAKDIKILWSRALGRCSMAECRKRLLTEASDAVSSGVTVLGEHCHIVGERETSPRGVSTLSQTDRDRYPNLILLCAEHHKIVDDDPETWPVERLHQIKADHEVWVESLVPESLDDEIETLYARLVNIATENLQLNRWPDVTAAAILDRVDQRLIDGVYQFAIAVTGTIWPGRIVELEVELKNLAERGSAYIDMYLIRARPDFNGSWTRDNRWKERWRDDYHEELARVHNWERECVRLLFNLTAALNRFADVVRSTIRPTYFLSSGKFFVVDMVGVLSHLQPKVYFPESYREEQGTGRHERAESEQQG